MTPPRMLAALALLALPAALAAGCGGDDDPGTTSAGSGAAGPGGGGSGGSGGEGAAGGGGGSGGAGGALGEVCQEHAPGTSADGDPVEICERTFSDRPFVRPPEDTTDGAQITLYGAILSVLGPARVLDRSGGAHLLVDAGGAPLSFPDGAAQLPAELRMPSNRNLYLIYRFTGVAGMAVDPESQQTVPSLQLTDARPAILLRGEAIDNALLGAWEGTVSARVGPDTWSEQDRVPLRVTFTTVEPVEDMMEWDDPAVTLPDGERFAMVGTIDNFTTSALASDGTCLPALSSLGQQNPFSGCCASPRCTSPATRSSCCPTPQARPGSPSTG